MSAETPPKPADSTASEGQPLVLPEEDQFMDQILVDSADIPANVQEAIRRANLLELQLSVEVGDEKDVMEQGSQSAENDIAAFNEQLINEREKVKVRVIEPDSQTAKDLSTALRDLNIGENSAIVIQTIRELQEGILEINDPELKKLVADVHIN